MGFWKFLCSGLYLYLIVSQLARSYHPCHNGNIGGFEFTFNKSCLYSVSLSRLTFAHAMKVQILAWKSLWIVLLLLKSLTLSSDTQVEMAETPKTSPQSSFSVCFKAICLPLSNLQPWQASSGQLQTAYWSWCDSLACSAIVLSPYYSFRHCRRMLLTHW